MCCLKKPLSGLRMSNVNNITSIVRDYLNKHGFTMVDIKDPMWDGKQWHVLVSFDDKPCGTVLVSSEGKVIKYLPFST